MNTFLPFESFAESARCLDRQRLGKQRLEVLQLLHAINSLDVRGWSKHPCTELWRGHTYALAAYGLAVCAEWIRRGYLDTTFDKIAPYQRSNEYTRPEWTTRPSTFHMYQRRLVFKDPAHYLPFFPGTEPLEMTDWNLLRAPHHCETAT